MAVMSLISTLFNIVSQKTETNATPLNYILINEMLINKRDYTLNQFIIFVKQKVKTKYNTTIENNKMLRILHMDLC